MVRIIYTVALAFAAAVMAAPSPQDPAGSANIGQGNGQQFITGSCTSDADCASQCCAKPAGKCSAVAVQFADGKQGCGFTR
jgi:hypothetical protein